jgi:hypothetical protein
LDVERLGMGNRGSRTIRKAVKEFRDGLPRLSSWSHFGDLVRAMEAIADEFDRQSVKIEDLERENRKMGLELAELRGKVDALQGT